LPGASGTKAWSSVVDYLIAEADVLTIALPAECTMPHARATVSHLRQP
jgi:hypothetical protein